MKNIGILDPKAKYKNPLNNRDYSKEYKELAKIWSKFPAYKNARQYIDIIKKNQVILVVSGTGSGKTVLFPKYTLHAFDYNAKIGITLPKQIITRSAAEFSAKTLDVTLGKEIGYKYRGSPSDSKSLDTKLLYATDGTIVAKLLHDPLLEEFDAIIVDEAHERKVQIDFLLYLLRETIKKRKNFKVIIMSATVNDEIFNNYFASFKYHNLNIGGKTNYKIESIFLEKKIKARDYISKGIDIIKNILKEDDLKKKESHDILFFVTSINEARNVCKTLSFENKDGIFCVEVYAGMDKDMQEYAQHEDLYKQDGKYNRKIVVATNVAESSLTIKGIKYVIDSGYELSSSYDVKLKGKKLEKVLISQAQAKQRMGRSGRTEPGICYHLYTKDIFDNKMKKFPEPAIRIQDLTTECLQLLNSSKFDNFKHLRKMLKKFIEPPDDKYITLAYENLNKYQLIEENKITTFGKMIAEFNIEPILGIPLYYSKLYNCFNEVLDIVSLISAANFKLEDIFLSAEKILRDNIELRQDKELYEQELDNLRKEINEKKLLFNNPSGDHLSILNAYNEFNNRYDDDDLYEWCEENYIVYNTFIKAKKYIKRTKMLVKEKIQLFNLDMEINSKILEKTLDNRILYCLYKGYFVQTAKKKNDTYYMNHFKNKKIKIDKNSFVHLNDEKPDKIFYHELFISSIDMSFNIVSKL